MVSYCANKKRLFLLGLAFFVIMSISGIYSLANEMKEAENTLSTRAVEIELKEYDDQDQPFHEDGKIVMPGDIIRLIPIVKNLGIDCYLRVRITYTIKDVVFKEQDYISGDYSTWRKEGYYYYYDGIFQRNDTVELFEQVSIPDPLANEFQGQEVKIRITAEAIQEKNFDGNWNNARIIESINKTIDIDGSGSSTIIYENDTENHITIPEGFFDNLGGLVPGDGASETITILNSGETKKSYFLKIENDLSSHEKKLLESFKLIIRNSKGRIVINKSLYNPSRYMIGSFDAGEGDSYTIEVLLPKEANNNVSKLLTKIRWIFSLDDYKEPIPYTGDTKLDLSLITFLLSTVGLIVVLFLERRYRKIEKERGKNYG